MATIKDIARECEVSISTVSNVLNGKSRASKETAELVLKKAKELNYIPNFMAKNLKQKKSKTIGIITEDLTIFHTPEIVDGINAYLEENGYSFILGNMRLFQKFGEEFYLHENYNEFVQAEIDEMLAKNIAGIIYVEGHCHVLEFGSDRICVPIVAVHGLAEDKDVSSVLYHDEKAAFDAVSALIAYGHKEIGLVLGVAESLHTIRRQTGYQKALYEHGVLFNPDYVIKGDWTRESGYIAAEELVKKGVTAIFAMNDIMAGGVYDYLKSCGMSVGEDISLVGISA